MKSWKIFNVYFLKIFCLVCLLPYFLPLIVDIIVPTRVFTFRVWETISVKQRNFILRGPFYPNTKIFKREYGELTPYTACAVAKHVTWETDRHGYRKRKSDNTDYQIVIVGDSNTVGSGLTQEDTIAEVLEHKSGLNIYPLAPANINDFLAYDRFTIHPPKLVILQVIERDLLKVSRPRSTAISEARKKLNAQFKIPFQSLYEPIAIFHDRLQKQASFNYFLSTLERRFQPEQASLCKAEKVGAPIFWQGLRANQIYSEEETDSIVLVLESTRHALNERGIEFIFLPVPNKESIYYDRLPVRKKPMLLDRLAEKLSDRDVDFVDTQTAFARAYQEDPDLLLYPLDDTHWNAQGVEIAAELIWQKIQAHDSQVKAAD